MICTEIVTRKHTAWPLGYKRRFYGDPDRNNLDSTSTLVTLLRPWTRRFTIGYPCLVASNKQQIQWS